MENLSLIDWDPESFEALAVFLPATHYQITQCPSASQFGKIPDSSIIDLVVVKVKNALIDGLDALKKIQSQNPDQAIVLASKSLDLESVIVLMKHGAFDCIQLNAPISVIASQIQVNCTQAVERELLRIQEMERMARDVENHQIMSWRAMYASKEVVQTEHLIHEMANTINASGGYEWLDLLKSISSPDAAGNLMIPKDIYDLILESATSQRKFFDFITFLSRLEKMAIKKFEHKAIQFSQETQGMVSKILQTLCTKYSRPFKLAFPPSESFIPAFVCQDVELLERCLRELIINAIKYSPEGSTILVGLDVDPGEKMSIMNLWVRNQPKQYQAKDSNGKSIVGVPYEYSERIFDLFYMIESFPTRLVEEEWTDGAGLHIVRKLLKRQGAWLSTSNGMDYTGFKTDPFVKFNIKIPLHTKRDFSVCNPKCSPCSFMLLRGLSAIQAR